MTDIYAFLAEHNIEYQRFDHQAVYTIADMDALDEPLPGTNTKNLFLRDDKGKKHYLLVVGHDTAVDLKALPAAIGSRKLGFASEQRLMKHLGLEPGAVSILALANDTVGAVEVFIDEALWQNEEFLAHPLVNTSTLLINKADLERFVAATNHTLNIVAVPRRA